MNEKKKSRAKTVCENLKMSAPLLSRFDLIFILLDKPDAYMDQLLSDHVMALHSAKGKANDKRGIGVVSVNVIFFFFFFLLIVQQKAPQPSQRNGNSTNLDAAPLAEWLRGCDSCFEQKAMT